MDLYYTVWESDLFGIAVAAGGIVVVTADGGITWTIATDGVTVGLYDVLDITVTADGVTVHDGLGLGLTLAGYRWREALGDTMADTQPAEFSFSLVDELGVKGTALMFAMVDPTKTVANLKTDWVSMGTVLDPVTGAQITGGRVRIVTSPDGGWKGTPASGSRLEQTAVINVGVAENARRWGTDIPGILDSLITSGKVNVAADAVKNLVKILDGTTGLVSGAAANAAFQVVTSAIDIVLSFRKHRRQLGRSSFEIIPSADA